MPDLASKSSLPKSVASKSALTLPSLADATPTKAGPKPMDEWRQAAGGKRPWGRRGEGSAGQRVLGALKTLGWLVPLTLAIWIYAEREQTATRSGFPLPIAAPPDTGTRIYRIVEPDNRELSLDLTGPQVGLDQLARDLRGEGRDGSHGGGAIEIAVPDQPGQHFYTISMLTQLNENRAFKRHGVTVRNCTPGTVRVETDELVERELKVERPPGPSVVTDPTFFPATVKVTAPSHIFLQAKNDNHLYLTAEMSDRVAKLAADPNHHPTDPKGQESLPAIPLSWPYGENGQHHVTFSTPTVSATVIFRAQESSYTIPSLGVQPTALVGLLKEYTIECPPNVTGVTVVGPPEVIAMLEDGRNHDAKALLEITPNDEAQVDVPIQRPLRFLLPNGVRVKDDKQYPITFTLKKR